MVSGNDINHNICLGFKTQRCTLEVFYKDAVYRVPICQCEVYFCDLNAKSFILLGDYNLTCFVITITNVGTSAKVF